MAQFFISRQVLEAIYRHAEETYPNECCGILAGAAGEPREARAAYRAENIAADARDRYELNPLDHLRIHKRCVQEQLEVIGFYHSHPDYPARPSQLDADGAWPEFVYLIVSLAGGSIEAASAWIYNGNLRKFQEESIIIREAGNG